MDNTEYIDSYFNGDNSIEQKKQFEQKIKEDASFAEEVAFYLSARATIKQQLEEEKKQRFREMYDRQKAVPMRRPVNRFWRYAAAASIAAIVAMIWFMQSVKTTGKQLADTYIQENWRDLPVTMGVEDSLQQGVGLYKAGRFTEALSVFKSLVQKDSSNDPAKKYAGIVSFRLKNYDKALSYFSALEKDTSAFSNAGTFYKAIILLERNKNGDKEEAKLLLQQVIDKDLEGKNDAKEWLKKLE